LEKVKIHKREIKNVTRAQASRRETHGGVELKSHAFQTLLLDVSGRFSRRWKEKLFNLKLELLYPIGKSIPCPFYNSLGRRLYQNKCDGRRTHLYRDI
jgi:hypothetical protein